LTARLVAILKSIHFLILPHWFPSDGRPVYADERLMP
jgi:hypothetical protein